MAVLSAPTLAQRRCSLPPEGAEFAAWGGPAPLMAFTMNFDTLRKYCKTLPGATVDIKWGADECHCVGRKMFAVFGVEKKKGTNVGFKCDPSRFLELTDLPGIIPAPYLARAHWVLVQDGKALTDAQACELVAQSHGLVMAKLTKKERESIASGKK